MTFGAVFVIALSIPFVFRIIYHALTLVSCSRPLPADVADIYSPEVYQKWQSFKKESSRYYLFRSILATAVYLILAGTDILYPLVMLFPLTKSAFILGPVLICFFVSIAYVPFHYYDQMVLKKRYGFCKQTAKRFWKEQLLFILTFLSVGFIISCLMFLCFFENTKDATVVLLNKPSILPLAAGGLMLSVLMNPGYYLYREIHDKKADLCKDGLKEEIDSISSRLGFKGQIKVARSDREHNLNAYYTPIGNKVVLYDTLIEALAEDEICGVVAHEIAHAKHGDFWMNLAADALLKLIACFAYWNQLNYCFSHAVLGMGPVIPLRDALLLIVSMFLYIPFSMMLRRYQARNSEFWADQTAVKCGYGESLISALKKAAQADFEELNPHPLLVALFEFYPPLVHRIKRIRRRNSGETHCREE